MYYSALIEPTSEYAEQIVSRMNESGYWICDKDGICELQHRAKALLNRCSAEKYLEFVGKLNDYLNISVTHIQYDERIVELLHMIAACGCDDHTVSGFADKVSLSPSRLSHLFKEQIGVPLKSYIVLHQMERAFKELLAGKTATQAAMNAGFNTPSHLAGTVKRMMGMPISLSLKDSEFLKVY